MIVWVIEMREPPATGGQTEWVFTGVAATLVHAMATVQITLDRFTEALPNGLAFETSTQDVRITAHYLEGFA